MLTFFGLTNSGFVFRISSTLQSLCIVSPARRDQLSQASNSAKKQIRVKQLVRQSTHFNPCLYYLTVLCDNVLSHAIKELSQTVHQAYHYTMSPGT